MGSLGSRSLDEELEILSNSDSSSTSGGVAEGGGGRGGGAGGGVAIGLQKTLKKEVNVVLPGPRMRLMAVDVK